LNRCPECIHAHIADDGEWRCHSPITNRQRPAFLAGRDGAAVRCYVERLAAAGHCGTKGRLFEPRQEPVAAIPILTVKAGGR
jgi:hypothetical protein